VSGENTYTRNVSTYSDRANIPNPSVISCNNNVNTGFWLYPNNTDLSELTLPTFTGSTSQLPLILTGT